MGMKMRLWAAVGILALSAAWANADAVISVGSMDVAVGTTAFVPVFISGSGNMNFSAFEFRITSSNMDGSQLAFMTVAGSPTDVDSRYVFYNDSSNAAFQSNLGNAVDPGFAYPNDTFIGGDSTLSGNDITLTTTQQILAWLPITTINGLGNGFTPAPPNVGDTFTISLVPTDSGVGTPTDLIGNTGFQGSDTTFLKFTSNAGIVSVQEVAAAPLPRPLLTIPLLMGMLGIALRFSRRKNVVAE